MGHGGEPPPNNEQYKHMGMCQNCGTPKTIGFLVKSSFFGGLLVTLFRHIADTLTCMLHHCFTQRVIGVHSGVLTLQGVTASPREGCETSDNSSCPSISTASPKNGSLGGCTVELHRASPSSSRLGQCYQRPNTLHTRPRSLCRCWTAELTKAAIVQPNGQHAWFGGFAG